MPVDEVDCADDVNDVDCAVVGAGVVALAMAERVAERMAEWWVEA